MLDMKNINFIIILILIIIFVAVFYSIFTSDRTDVDVIVTPEEVAFEVKNVDTSISDDPAFVEVTSNETLNELAKVKKDNTLIANDDNSVTIANTTTVNLIADEEIVIPGKYVTYAGESEVSLAAEDGSAVLFFHASWCPTCRSLERAIKNEENNIPKGLTIFKVDYDSESELKRKYKVAYQHTLIQVDSSLNQISKWTGSRDLSAIVSKIQ